MGGTLDHPFFDEEVERQKRLRANYLRLRDRHSDKSPEWWFDTHGIDVAEMRQIAQMNEIGLSWVGCRGLEKRQRRDGKNSCRVEVSF